MWTRLKEWMSTEGAERRAKERAASRFECWACGLQRPGWHRYYRNLCLTCARKSNLKHSGPPKERLFERMKPYKHDIIDGLIVAIVGLFALGFLFTMLWLLEGPQ